MNKKQASGELVSSATASLPGSDARTPSETTMTDLEIQREHVCEDSLSGFAYPMRGVSVEQAEADFAELQKELSGMSRQHSRVSGHYARTDVEKSGEYSQDGSERFDLEDTLRGNKKDDEESGIRPKHIGVIWDNLTVRGVGGTENYVQTFPDAIIGFFNIFQTAKDLLGLRRHSQRVNILQNFRGVAKPGQMVLVLGRPGSGCTTFLKVIANQRFGYTDIHGDVQYGPFNAKTFAAKYRGEAVYNQEDDIHHPTLTVGQTIGFALDIKTPGKRPLGISKKEFKDKVITTVLKMFNIEHTRNTMVGNAMMMTTSATLLAWDNTTRGLDASTALDYVRSLRVMTNIYKTTTFVSLYQASENIYEQFDKVLVIDGGLEVYFGPAKVARKYFENLGFKEKPRQTTPDYLTGCTDPFEREYADGYSPENAPHSPETLEKAFSESKLSRDLNVEMATYRKEVEQEKERWNNFQVAVKESKQRGASRSVYSVGFHLQIWALIQRQFLIKWQDKFSLVVSWLTAIIVAIQVGTVWLDLPKTSNGAFTRGGAIFIALMFNVFEAFSELASTIAFAFYRPSALWVAQIFVDLLFKSVQILVFSIIVYFMCNLALNAGAFFVFYIVIVLVYISMTLFFRTIGCLCPDFDYAIKFVAYQYGQKWIRWIFWINPMGLGFAAMMANEFKRLSMTCEALIPNGPGYGNLANQVCTLAGSIAGSLEVSGSDYITAAFEYKASDIWRNFGIILAFIAFFLAANMWLGEKITFGAGGNTAKVFQKPNEERKRLSQRLNQKRDARRAVLTWEDLCYDVPVVGGQLRLLNNIFGYVKPGELTALMGASGAGKTTLWMYTLVDGRNLATLSTWTSYAEQLDVHEPTSTVREALQFSATLRQPCYIGTPESGLAVEQRKRVTIGPTSGLDSQSAFNIVRFLRKLAARDKLSCVLFITQCRAFRELRPTPLASRGGRCVYLVTLVKTLLFSGPTLLAIVLMSSGRQPSRMDARCYWRRPTPRIGDCDWADLFAKSPDNPVKEVGETIASDDRDMHPSLASTQSRPQRMHIGFWRSPNYGFTRLFNHVVVALIVGLAYLNLSNSATALQYRIFVISIMIFYRESSSKMYGQFAFASSLVMAELPYSIICAVGFFVPLYYIPGILITEMFSVTLGQMIAALTPMPHLVVAALVNPFRAVFVNAPAGQTCGEYMERFFTNGGAGYIVDNATALCQYCSYKVGDQFYEPLDFKFDHRWRDFGIFTAFLGSNLILLFLGSRYLNFNKR
ncbi:hypothetical protein B0O99DRAFT_662220 [Bisporella sp. PMI_857]|nr:hypothetical protein B0O99DRAFT_662220 [Bisporella sp. PMI_857]